MRNRASVKNAQFSVHPAAKNYTFDRKMDDYNFFALSKYMKRQHALYYPFKDSY